MFKKLNDAMPGLVRGILLYGAVVWAVGVWFVNDGISFTVGLLIGLALAVGMAVHMAWVLRDVVDFADARRAGGRIIAKSILRYVVVIGVFVWMYVSGIGNLVAAFIGLLGLKVSAYLEPVMWRVTGHAAVQQNMRGEPFDR